jgi:hypothetical protein
MQPTTEVVIFLPDPLALVILLCVLAALRVQIDDDTIAITSIAAIVMNIVSLYISIKTAGNLFKIFPFGSGLALSRNY